MRTLTTCMLMAALLIAAPLAEAGTTNDPEITDALGDVGPGPGLGPAGAEADIESAWFSATASGRNVDDADMEGAARTACAHPCEDETVAGTWVTMRLASFEVRPLQVVYGVLYETGNASAWVAYGRVIDPSLSGVHGGFYGCRDTSDADRVAGDTLTLHGDCMALEGEILEDASGFRVRLPDGWAPPGATLTNARAKTFLLSPPVPEGGGPAAGALASASVLDATQPGRDYVVPGPASGDAPEDLAVTGAEASEEGVKAVPLGAEALIGVLGSVLILARARRSARTTHLTSKRHPK